MSRLSRLNDKRDDRVRRRKRHYAKWERFKANGKRARAKWHLTRFRQQIKAIKKLNRLIDIEEKRLDDLRIDWQGKEPVGGPQLRKIIRYGLNKNPGCYVTSTNGGVHTPTSYHYLNEAVDIGANSIEEKTKFQHDIYEEFGPSVFAELFGPDNYPWVKNGSTYTATEGDDLETLHDTHVHVAITN